jgi:hypothetical protein
MDNARDRRRIAVVEHVDPDRDAGPDRLNAVLACAACNEYKGRRTPDEAGMQLLPIPTGEQIAYWHERGEQQFDRPELGLPHPADRVPDKPPDNPTDKPPDKPTDNAQTTSHTTSSSVVPRLVQGVPGTPNDDHVSAGGGHNNALDNDPEGSGSGRVGQPHSVAVFGAGAQPVRQPAAPDIYTRRSRPPQVPP